MTKSKIYRINELYKKSKTLGLTEDEKNEQRQLRQEYIHDTKSNFVNSLENMVIVDEKGNKKSIKSKNREDIQ